MLLGELDIGGAGFLKTIQSLDKGFGSFMGKLGKIGAIAGGSFVAFQGLQMVMQGFGESLNLGGKLNDLSLQTGEAVGDLVIMRQAFENAGLGADSAGDFLLKLQDSIAGVNEDGKSTAGALDALGVSAEGLRNLSGLGQIEALQKGFAGIADQSARVQVARDLFGKSGGKSLALLGDAGVLDQARQQAGPLAGIMEKNVATFDKLGDVMNGLKLNFQEFFAGALSKIAPEATNIADALGGIDFVGIGETVGSLAGTFLKLADILAGPLSTAVNFVSEGLSWLLGSGSKASSGMAQKYKGFAKTAAGENEAKTRDQQTVVGALQRIGGGGSGGVGDPLLAEQRTHTRLLQRIADNVARPSTPGNFVPVPI